VSLSSGTPIAFGGDGEQWSTTVRLPSQTAEFTGEGETEQLAPLNPYYEWIGATRTYLQSIKEQLHPAVFALAVRMLPGVAELHATDKPVLCPGEDGSLSFAWIGDKESPLYGMEINLFAPDRPAEEYQQYNPWKVGQAPVHPPGVWKEAP
jgi:hypothetical protein